MSAELLFWIVHLPLMVLFLAGMGYVVRLWLRGTVPGAPNEGPGGKVRWLVGQLFRHLPALLRALIIETWFNRRLWRNDRWRWAAHFLLLTGFMLLMTLSGVAALSEKVLYYVFHLGHVPWISMWYTADHPVTGLLNEIGGALMTVGLVFFVVRRYVFRPAQLRTGPMDHWMVAGLGLILLSGWATEIVRLNSTHIGPAPYVAFIGYPLSRLVTSLSVDWDRWYDILYVGHGLLTSVVIVTVPFSKFLHAVAGGLVAVVNAATPPVFIPGRPTPLPYTLRQMVELDGCTRCGECIVWCPTFAEKPDREAITPLTKIETARRFVRREHGPPTPTVLRIHSDGTYDCTLCGRCGTVCPVHIDTRHLWIAMREDLVQRGVYPETLDRLRETVTTHYNISGDPNTDRLIWSQNLDQIPEGVGGKEHAEVVYFVGCVSSFYPQTYSVPQSMVEVLDRAGVDFMVLGTKEWCCGFPLIIAGMGEAVIESVRHNVEAVRGTGAARLVATCPSCYHTWKHDYPRILGEPLGFEVVHATQLLTEIVHRLPLRPLEETVTYHDPCDLGRTSGVYDAPRQVIRAIPGVTLVEMEHHHEYSLCCGGGGDVEMADKSLTEAVARRRIGEAQATGARVLLSACQQCKRTLMGAARREKVRVRVMDVVE
ncbi:MAG TPA: hypothetical protein EYP52_08075, partial [Anaerolineae bacterium]|nr:hypothetical protein [Anaerolineae bacterium]